MTSAAVRILGLWLLTAMAFAGAFEAPFELDDSLFTDRRQNSPIGFRWLLNKTFDLQVGSEPQAYHLVNIGIHTINVSLIYGILGVIVPETAWAGAALFAVHPLFGESVQYVYARSSSLAAMFVWLGLLAFLRLPGLWRWGVIALSVVGGALSKEEGLFVIPVLLLVMLFYDRQVALKAILVAGVAAGLIMSRWPLLSSSIGAGANREVNGFFQKLSLWQHTKVIVNAFALQILPNVVAPWRLPAEPGLDYGSNWRFFASLAILGGLSTLLLIRRINWRVRLGILLVLATPPLARVLITIDNTAFDYRAYMCGLGFALLAAVGISYLKRLRTAIAASAIAALFLLTAYRNEVWSDPVALWEESMQDSPGLRPAMNLGVAYHAAGRISDEARLYNDILKQYPNAGTVETSLATIYLNAQEWGLADRHFRHVLQQGPSFMAYANYTVLLMRTGRLDEAETAYQHAMELAPDPSFLKLTRQSLTALEK